MLLIEPYGGTAAVSRALLGGCNRLGEPKIPSLVSYMGAKGKLALPLLRLMRLEPATRAPVRVFYNDASTIGKVMQGILSGLAGAIAGHLDSWQGEDARALWNRLREAGPPADPALYAASWLWLQARAASGVPVWWVDSTVKNRDNTGRVKGTGSKGGKRLVKRNKTQTDIAPVYERSKLVSMSGNNDGPYLAHQKSPTLVSMDGHGRGPYPAWQMTGLFALEREHLQTETTGEPGMTIGGGIVHPATVAKRVRQMEAGFAGKVTINTKPAYEYFLSMQGLLRDAAQAGERVIVYLDPPYVGCTGYECTSSRSEVVEIAMRLDRLGCEVYVSEGTSIPELHGWDCVALPSRKRGAEWLTANRPLERQCMMGSLFAGATLHREATP